VATSEAKSKAINLKETNAELARKEFEEREKAMLGDLKQNIEKLIESNPALQQFKSQLLIDITSEGLRIQIVDEQNRPMFDTSSAELKPYTRVILREIGKALNAVPNKLSLSGIPTQRSSAVATRVSRTGSFRPIVRTLPGAR
jgi:chemotaxis protein MotB